MGASVIFLPTTTNCEKKTFIARDGTYTGAFVYSSKRRLSLSANSRIQRRGEAWHSHGHQGTA
jgi:hypothetical protein